jgi:hypothetical protein
VKNDPGGEAFQLCLAQNVDLGCVVGEERRHAVATPGRVPARET